MPAPQERLLVSISVGTRIAVGGGGVGELSNIILMVQKNKNRGCKGRWCARVRSLFVLRIKKPESVLGKSIYKFECVYVLL